MTDQDNLRDRIEEIIWKRTTLPTDTTTLIAQAIIDEFELTVETAISLDEIPEHLQGEFIDSAELIAWAEDKPKKSRIVGKWEKQ